MFRNLSAVAFIALLITLATAATAAAAGPKITGSSRTTCALSDAGAVSCWGENVLGALGNGNTTDTHVAQPVVGLSSGVVDIAVGESFGCAVRVNGNVACWGRNSSGQVTPGSGDSDAHPVPADVPGISGAVAVAAAYSAVCVVLADGTARCWGHDGYGQMGDDGPTGSTTHPIVQVQGVSGIKEIDAANFGFCALLTDGTVSCWGMNWEGQLGRLPAGFGSHSSKPELVAGINGATQLVGGDSACALIGVDSTVRCWGDNFYYGAGDPAAPDVITTPVAVPGLAGVVSLAGSSNSKCVWLVDKTVKCWGYNLHHQLSPENGDVGPPRTVTFSGEPILLNDGGDSSLLCWMTKGGGVTCRGSNYNGESGSPNINDGGVGDTVVPGVDLITRAYPSATAPTFKRSGKVKVDKRKKNYRLKADAAFTPSELVPFAEACAGKVRATATYSYKAVKKKKRVKRKKIWKATASLKTVGTTCVARIDFKKLPVKTLNKQRIVVSADFAGNSAAQALKFPALKVKLPRVKVKKKRKR